jgi:hypothetical protein
MFLMHRVDLKGIKELNKLFFFKIVPNAPLDLKVPTVWI